MSHQDMILIVDDDPDLREVLRDLLQHEGYQVHDVGSGAAAVDRARQDRYAVLLDMHLPDAHGQTVLQRLRELDAALPVIVVTGHVTDDNTVGSLMKGAFAYITKPHKPDEIRATVRRAVSVRALAERSETFQTALSESEQRFQCLVESAHDAIIVADPQGIIVSWNKSAERMFQYAEPEIVGRPLTTIMPPKYREAHRRGLAHLNATGESRLLGHTVELEGLKKDGTIFPTELSLATWPTQHGRFFSGIIRDLTERKEAHDALRRAHDLVETILASLPGAILIADQDGTIVYANPLAGRAFGSAETGPLTGRNVLDVLPLRPPEWTMLVQGLKNLSARSPVGQPDGECAVKDRVYQYRAFPMSPRGAERLQVGLVLWDVTEQKQLQDHLIQAEKLASLGTLVSGMAHEINNPMQGILGTAEVVLEEQDPEKIKEYARDIVEYSQHIATLVRNFCAYARPSFREDETEVDVRERLMEAAKMVQRSPHFGQVEIVTHLDPVPLLRARRAEIDQVFVNLISNAVQAMNGRGRLTLTTRPDGPSATATITDSGCGMPKHLMTKIFDPFFTTKDPGEGTGLGLSIVHKIVSKYSGTIKVQSEEGKGTTFILQFPIEKNPAGGASWSNRPTLH